MKWRGIALAAVLVFLALACIQRADESRQAPPSAPRKPQPVLPREPGTLFPSEATLVGAAPGKTERLQEGECETCHAQEAEGWKASAHARVLDVPRARTMCVGCHSPTALPSMTGPSRDSAPPPRHGVTCRGCHGVVSAGLQGNASFALDVSDIPVPHPGDPASTSAHRRRVAVDASRAAELCAGCHRGFRVDGDKPGDHELAALDDVTPWMTSAYAGSLSARVDPDVPQLSCVDCHMRKSATGPPGKSHGVSWHQPSDGTDKHDAPVTVHIGAIVQASGPTYVHNAPINLMAGEDVRVDVVTRNVGVGHRFPGGATDRADAWLELTVADSSGKPLLAAGAFHEGTDLDDTTHVFRAYSAGGGVDTTIAPRDAVVTSYAVHVPAWLPKDSLPLTITVRLRRRGGAFGQSVFARPVLDLDVAKVRLDSPTNVWQDALDYATGLSHAPDDALLPARAAAEYALQTAETDTERALASAQLADILGRSGDLAGARRHLGPARDRFGDHAALARIEARALLTRGLHGDAAWYLTNAAARSPNDVTSLAGLATARESVLDHMGALEAATRGLARAPRNVDLLRAQALALRAMESGGDATARAAAAYLRSQGQDASLWLRTSCVETVASCAMEALPMHVHGTFQVTGPPAATEPP